MKKHFLLKGAYNMFNFGDDLLLIAILEYMNKMMNYSNETTEIYIDKYKESLKHLKYDSPFKLRNAYEIDDILRDEKSKLNRYRILFILRKPILLISLFWFVINMMIYKIFKHTFAYHRFINFINKLDVIYFIGGGYIAGKWKKRLIIEALTVNIAKWINPSIKIIGTGLGIGPFKHNHVFISLLKKFNYFYTRERKSFKIVQKAHLSIISEALGDDVSLLLPFLKNIKTDNRSQNPKIGINLKSFRDHHYGSVELNLKETIKYFEMRGYQIEMYLFGQTPGPKDEKVANKFLTDMNINSVTIYNPYELGWIEFLKKLSQLQAGLGFAYHFNVILTLFEVPLISVYSGQYYKQKIEGVIHCLNPYANITSMETLRHLSAEKIYHRLVNSRNSFGQIEQIYKEMDKRYTNMFNNL